MKNLKEKAQEVAGKMYDAAEEAVGKAKEFLDEKTEIVKLEWELAKKKNGIDALFLNYGKLCYNKPADDDEVVACYDLLVEAEAEICSIEAEIKELKEEEEMKAAEKEAEKNTVFCTKCGKEYKDNEKFCSKCGTKLSK